MQVIPAENLTAAERATIKAEVDADPTSMGYHNPDGSLTLVSEVIRLLLLRPMVPNPNPQQQTLVPLDLNTLLGLLPMAELANVPDMTLAEMKQAVLDQDRAALTRWGTIELAKGRITQPTFDAIAAKLAETEPDPSWPATVPGQRRIDVVVGRAVNGPRHDEISNALAGT